MYPEKRVCSECSINYDAVASNQTVCISCSLRPAKLRKIVFDQKLVDDILKPPVEEDIIDITNQEEEDMVKDCITCGQEFEARGNNAKFCDKCRPYIKKSPAVEAMEPPIDLPENPPETPVVLGLTEDQMDAMVKPPENIAPLQLQLAPSQLEFKALCDRILGSNVHSIIYDFGTYIVNISKKGV